MNVDLSALALLAEGGRDRQDSERRRPGAAKVLVELAADAELFHDAGGDAWITFQVNEHRETHPLRSKATRSWLAARFYRQEGRPPGSQALADALDVLEARARFDGACHTVHVRVAGRDGRVYLDLGGPDWRAIEVDRHGWRIVDEPPVKFWRPRGLLPLPEPAGGGSLDELLALLNVDEEGFILLSAWLLAALRPRGPYPILALEGEQGSGKSTAARMLRALVDPHEAALRRPPRHEHDLFIAAGNAWIVAFDNLSGVPVWLSDALCVLATGGAFTARTLYSDREETLLAAQRPVILTGIDDLAVQADLRDRTLRVELQRLDDAETLDEATLWARFEQARPRLLGALLDAVAAALRHWAETKLERAPRMADFARWVAAGERGRAVPWQPGRFLDLYVDHRRAAAAQVLDEPLAQAVLEVVAGGEWSGTASELLQAVADRVDERALRLKGWPKTPAALSNRLKRLAPELRRGVGVDVVFDREGRDRRRIIRLYRQEQVGNGAPASSAASAGARSPSVARVSGLGSADDARTMSVRADDGASAASAAASAPAGPETLAPQGFLEGADDADDADDGLQGLSGEADVVEVWWA